MGENRYNLTEGSIFQKLLVVSLPIMGNQLVQMAYNLADMFWLGRLSSDAVAAAATVGMYMWLSMAFINYGSKGAEIGVSQNVGRQDMAAARRYGESSLSIAWMMGLAYAFVMVAFHKPLVGFFRLNDAVVEGAAIQYLLWVSIGIPFSFATYAATGVFIGSGNSRTPFVVNAISLVTNILLDPILIFGANMGIVGAAIATSAAQILGCVLLLAALRRGNSSPFPKFRLFSLPGRHETKRIFLWATPIAVEAFLFTFFSMFATRMVTQWGPKALAAQKVASQLESLSWLIAGGFSAALAAFVGQNFGAGKWGRIRRGFRISSLSMAAWGVAVTFILFFFARPFISLFLPNEPEAVEIGVNMARILAVCQVLACLEGVASGAFRGLGKTIPPSLVSVTCNGIRVVVAYFLMQGPLGLNGIWWAISAGAGVRGLWMFIWYLLYGRSLPKKDVESLSV